MITVVAASTNDVGEAVLSLPVLLEGLVDDLTEYYRRIGGPPENEIEETIAQGVTWMARNGFTGILEKRATEVQEGVKAVLSFKRNELSLDSTLYEPVHALMKGLRIAQSSTGSSKRALYQISDLHQIFEVHKRTRAQVGFYLYFMGVESFFKALETSDNPRIKTILFFETDVLKFVLNSPGNRRYRTYSPEMDNEETIDKSILIIENWLTRGVPEKGEKRDKALEIFQKYLQTKEKAWLAAGKLAYSEIRDMIQPEIERITDDIDQLDASN